MPSLISAAVTGQGLIYYTLFGTIDYEATLDWYVDLYAIQDDVDLKVTYINVYDGYTLNLENLYLEYALEDLDDHNMICLYAKEACNCAVCSGLYYDDDETEILAIASYYVADDFQQWAYGNIAEPTAVDISEGWFAVNIDGSYEDNLTGAVGDGYSVWRFQPDYQPTLVNYGDDYRFQAGDLVTPYVWLRDATTSASNVITVEDYWYPSNPADAVEQTFMAASCLIFSMAATTLATLVL